jgi:lipoyl(octanoyl) transferase
MLEAWIIATLAEFNVKGERRDGRVGVWVTRPEINDDQTIGVREDKIAAIGVKIRKWITFHGISINVTPDLSHYDSIVPCGIQGHGVTSLADLGLTASLTDVDAALAKTFGTVFDDSQS